MEEGKQPKLYSRSKVHYYVYDPNACPILNCNYVASIAFKSSDTVVVHSQSAIVPLLLEKLYLTLLNFT
jgi:hypothetical protein